MNQKDREEFNALERRAAAAEATLALAVQRGDEARADLERERTLWARERYELMERLRAPSLVPPPPASDGVSRKLHYSEDDELDGLSVQEVAARAGLSVAHQYAIAKIDEVAVAEGPE